MAYHATNVDAKYLRVKGSERKSKPAQAGVCSQQPGPKEKIDVREADIVSIMV